MNVSLVGETLRRWLESGLGLLHPLLAVSSVLRHTLWIIDIFLVYMQETTVRLRVEVSAVLLELLQSFLLIDDLTGSDGVEVDGLM